MSNEFKGFLCSVDYVCAGVFYVVLNHLTKFFIFYSFLVNFCVIFLSLKDIWLVFLLCIYPDQKNLGLNLDLSDRGVMFSPLLPCLVPNQPAVPYANKPGVNKMPTSSAKEDFICH